MTGIWWLYLLSLSCRKVVEINLTNNCKIEDNCTFGSIYSEHLLKRGREFYTTLHLPLVRSDYEYQFVVKNKTKKNDQDWNDFPDNQNIYIWILQEILLQPNRTCNKTQTGLPLPVRMKYLNSLENIRVPRREQHMQ